MQARLTGTLHTALVQQPWNVLQKFSSRGTSCKSLDTQVGVQARLAGAHHTTPLGHYPAAGFEPPHLELVLPALPLEYGGVRAGVHRQQYITRIYQKKAGCALGSWNGLWM